MGADDNDAHDAVSDDDGEGSERGSDVPLPAFDSAVDAIVLNETLVVSEDWNDGQASAAVRWSLLRSTAAATPFVTVTTDTDDPHISVVAADIRIELLGDDLYNRLTRGVEVVLHDYEVLAGPAEWLRRAAGQALVQEIAGHAITWPLR